MLNTEHLSNYYAIVTTHYTYRNKQMDYYTYNSSSKVKAAAHTQALKNARKAKQTTRSAYAANVLLASTAKSNNKYS